jgi:succinoglycan biosynthesis protein ExoW
MLLVVVGNDEAGLHGRRGTIPIRPILSPASIVSELIGGIPMKESPLQDAQPLLGMASVPEVAVIIPYYQKEGRILENSVRSVFRQVGAPPVRIIVVDDGSPASVEPELAGLDPASRDCITVVRQKNQGPGPARNTGLAAVSDATKYIAFLDSDDIWHEHHLSRAIAMMEKGFDFYFADGDMEGGESSLFETVKFDDSDHPDVVEDRQLFEFCGNFLSLLLER